MFNLAAHQFLCDCTSLDILGEREFTKIVNIKNLMEIY